MSDFAVDPMLILAQYGLDWPWFPNDPPPVEPTPGQVLVERTSITLQARQRSSVW